MYLHPALHRVTGFLVICFEALEVLCIFHKRLSYFSFAVLFVSLFGVADKR